MNETAKFLRNVLVKAVVLFTALNLIFAVIDPMPWLGKISMYNRIVPGRERFPFGEEPDKAYNLSLFNLDAMFAAHKLGGSGKGEDEFRVFLIGDSSTWGFYLENKDTLASLLNQAGLHTDSGKQITVYNLGYPTISLTKDLMILDHAMQYQPDMIVWLVTLESFPYEKQLFTPLVQNNPAYVRPLIENYGLALDANSSEFVTPNFWQRTIIGQRRPLADLLRLQAYGIPWAATGIDQYIPKEYTPRAEDLEAVETYYGLEKGELRKEDIAFDVLAAGIERAGDVPVLIVNEPMFVSNGENSEMRYNFFYPRWVYDAYRELLATLSEANGWQMIDLWQAVDNTEFTNSAIHLTPEGSGQLAKALIPILLEIADQR